MVAHGTIVPGGVDHHRTYKLEMKQPIEEIGEDEVILMSFGAEVSTTDSGHHITIHEINHLASGDPAGALPEVQKTIRGLLGLLAKAVR
ncbi:MAG TPA: hypothetical protein VIV15_04110 [Anaerolineales bacterium]